jgi:hypothetical protein
VGWLFRTQLLAKHSKNFSLEVCLSTAYQLAFDRMQRNFEPMRQQVETWRAQQLSPAAAKLTIYRRSLKATWRSRSTRHGRSTNSISLRSTRSLSKEPCGACPTRSHRRFRNSIPFRNSGRQSWVVFFKRRAQRFDGCHISSRVRGNGLVRVVRSCEAAGLTRRQFMRLSPWRRIAL